MTVSERHSCHQDFLELCSLFEICYTSRVYKATSTSLLRDLILSETRTSQLAQIPRETHNFGRGRCLSVVSFRASCFTGVPGTILQNKLNPLFLIISHPHSYCYKLQASSILSLSTNSQILPC